MAENLLVLSFSYLIGAIPFSYLIARYWKGLDIRQMGSGNVGSTNVWRNAGPAAGILAFAGDFGKGVLAVLLARHFGGPSLIALAGAAALIGHSFPVFLRFKGGKLVATGVGVLCAITPALGLLTAAGWLLVLLLTRYVSLASIIAVGTTPLLTLFLSLEPPYLALTFFFAMFTALKHQANIKRLLAGTEPKIR